MGFSKAVIAPAYVTPATRPPQHRQALTRATSPPAQPRPNAALLPICWPLCGGSSVGRASASQAEGREFDSRPPLWGNPMDAGVSRSETSRAERAQVLRLVVADDYVDLQIADGDARPRRSPALRWRSSCSRSAAAASDHRRYGTVKAAVLDERGRSRVARDRVPESRHAPTCLRAVGRWSTGAGLTPERGRRRCPGRPARASGQRALAAVAGGLGNRRGCRGCRSGRGIRQADRATRVASPSCEETVAFAIRRCTVLGDGRRDAAGRPSERTPGCSSAPHRTRSIRGSSRSLPGTGSRKPAVCRTCPGPECGRSS